jgi:hypothetical protein
LIKVSIFIPESKPTKDGMEGYSKFVNLMVNYIKRKEVLAVSFESQSLKVK